MWIITACGEIPTDAASLRAVDVGLARDGEQEFQRDRRLVVFQLSSSERFFSPVKLSPPNKTYFFVVTASRYAFGK
jgi:hypothetical protein